MRRRQATSILPYAASIATSFMLFGAPAHATTTFGDGFSSSLTTELQDDVRIINNSQLTIAPSGWVRNSRPPGASVFDTSRLIVAGGRITNAFSVFTDSPAVLLNDHADMLILDGYVWHIGSWPGGATAVGLGDNARLFIAGGDVYGSTSAPGNAVGIRATRNAYVEITGGSLRATTSGTGFATAIVAEDEARVLITGGDISAASSSPGSTGLVANGSSMFTIAGSRFNYPAQVPISDLSGRIQGRLGDGTPFSLSFVREPTATILLIVPEPGTLPLCVLGGAAAVFRSKRVVGRRSMAGRLV